MARPETVSDLRRETAEVSLIVAAWGGHVGSGAPLSTTTDNLDSTSTTECIVLSIYVLQYYSSLL